jgi:hypothetical protein
METVDVHEAGAEPPTFISDVKEIAMRTRLLPLCLLACGIAASCSSPREDVKVIPAPIAAEPARAPEPERLYKYEDRFFVRHAALAPPTAVDDPLQAIRVIQLKEGEGDVLVISAFGTTTVDGATYNTETWLGIELPSIARGRYDLARNAKLMFYRFILGSSSSRFEGVSYQGGLEVESIADGYIAGAVDLEINGITKSFTAPPRKESLAFSGSFRIKDVPLEATIIRSK